MLLAGGSRDSSVRPPRSATSRDREARLMNQFVRRMMSIGIGCLPWVPLAASGQAPPRPSPLTSPSPFDTAELDNLTRQLAQRVQKLGDEITEELGKTPTGPTLVQD